MARFSGFLLFALASGSLGLVGCDSANGAEVKKDSAAAALPAVPSTPSAAPVGSVANAAAPTAAQASYSEQTFAVSISGPVNAVVGQPVEISVRLEAKDGFKVNAEYPIKFRFETSDAVEPELPVLKQEQATIRTYEAELKGKAKITKAGAQSVRGKLFFGVCRADVCLPESRDLAFTISAS